MSKELQLLRKNLLAPYKKFLLYDDKGMLKTVDWDKFNQTFEPKHLLLEKISLVEALQVSAAIYRTIKELENGS